MTAPVRVAFLGNDPWSVPTLDRLARTADVDVVLVVTNPPRPAGRGSKLTATAVADAARPLALPLEERETTRDDGFLERLRALAPDVSIVVAYGELLSSEVLNAPRLGSVNVHFSLLPRWRGASPVQHAILAGDPVTGVTLMQMDEGLDTGPVLARREEPIRSDDDAGSLGARLAGIGAEMVIRLLPDLAAGRVTSSPPGGRRHVRPQARGGRPRDRLVAARRRARATCPCVRPGPGRDHAVQGRGPQGPSRGRGRTCGGAAAGSRSSASIARASSSATGSGTVLVLEVAAAGRRRMPAADLGPGRARSGRRAARIMTTARSVAVETVRRVTDEDAYSTRVLPALLERSRLVPRDRALATELALGTLRHIPGLDRAIGQRATRPVARMSPGARAALRLGAYQLLFMRIPRHAAVSESVDLATPRERGFVNAVLRKIADEPPTPPTGATDEDVFMRTGMSPWAVRELRRILGDDEAEVAAEAFGERGLLSLRTNTCKTTVEAFVRGLRASGHTPRPAQLHPDCVLLDGGDPSRLRGFAQGWFAVQDQASAFVVGALDPQPGDRVLDVCAAPGGKAAHMACLVGESGTVIAADVRPERAALVKSTAERLGVAVGVVAQDATRPSVDAAFDRVLVDAPCSGIGSARRRPELLWRPRARRPLLARPAPGGHRIGRRRPAPAGRPPRLLGVHLPACRDRRGVRCARSPSTRAGARRDRGSRRVHGAGPPVATPSRFGRHVRGCLPQAPLMVRVR